MTLPRQSHEPTTGSQAAVVDYARGDSSGTSAASYCPAFEDFRYVREIGSQDAADHALVFQARVGGRQIEGCDFLHVDDGGSIDELTVMVRPLSAALALAEAMNALLSHPGNSPHA